MNTAAVWAIFVGGILGAIGAFLSLFGDSAAMGLLVLLASPLVGLGVFGALVTRMRKKAAQAAIVQVKHREGPRPAPVPMMVSHVAAPPVVPPKPVEPSGPTHALITLYRFRPGLGDPVIKKAEAELSILFGHSTGYLSSQLVRTGPSELFVITTWLTADQADEAVDRTMKWTKATFAQAVLAVENHLGSVIPQTA